MSDDADNAMKLLEELKKGLVPFGKLTTYKSVGKVLAIRPREVGAACRTLGLQPKTKRLPYHRVICQDGWLPSSFSAGGRERHIKLLEREGHKVEQVEEGYIVLDFKDCLQEP